MRVSLLSDKSSLELAIGREERTLVTVLCRESIGLLARGIEAVASLALDELELLSSSRGWPLRCKPAMGVGSPDCWRWGWLGVATGAFLRP
jgi:hypothetical protein